MRFILSVIALLLSSLVLAQEVSESPTYSFSIKKKITPPILELTPGTLRFIDDNENSAIDAKEHGKIQFELTNSGFGDGFGLKAQVNLIGDKAGISIPAVSLIPNIKVGKSTICEIDVETNLNTRDGRLLIEILILEPNGFGLGPMTLEVETRAFLSPDITIVDYSLTGNDILTKKQPFELQVLVQNIGKGDAEEVKSVLRLPENIFCLSGNENVEIGRLAPGEVKELTYSLIVNQLYSDDLIPIAIDLFESFGRYASSWTEDFRLNQAMALTKVSVQSQAADIKSSPIASLHSDVDRNIPSSNSKYSNRYAVVIGNEDYASRSASLDPEVNVDFAINDAVIFSEYLTSALGVPEGNLKLLKDATSGEIKQAIAWLENVARAEGGEAELIFYYSGHGLPDPADKVPYLIPVDVSGSYPKLGVSLHDLYAQLTNHPVKRVLVLLDACFSGGARNEELVAMKGLRVEPKKGAVPSPVLVFASSSGNETSGVYREKQHGYFTYFLLKSIQTRGSSFALGEVFDEVRKNVDKESARKGNVQQPQVLCAPGLKDVWPDWTLD